MRNLVKITAVALILLLIAGCNTRLGQRLGGASKEVHPPAALTDVDARLDVQQVWQRNIGQGERRLGLRLTPTVADGRVYVADPGGTLRALNASDGREIWSRSSGLRLSSGPGVGGGLVIATSLDGDVVAFDADTGAPRWESSVSAEVNASPLVAQGLAVVRSADGRTFGISLEDGSRRWVFERGIMPLALRGTSQPVLGSGLVYLGFDDGVIAAVRLDDGLRVWEQEVAEPQGRSEIERMAGITGELRVDRNEVFAASYGGQVMVLEGRSGQPGWARDIRSYAGVGLVGQQVIVGDERSTLWALDRDSGAAVWRQEALLNRWLTSPAIQAGHVLVGDFDGYLHWVSADSGAVIARTRHSRNRIRATPQVGPDGTAYVLDTRGQLTAYRVSRR